MYLLYPLFLVVLAVFLLQVNLKVRSTPSKAASFILMWVCIVWAFCWATWGAISLSVYTP